MANAIDQTERTRMGYGLIVKVGLAIVVGLAVGYFDRSSPSGPILAQVVGSIQYLCGQLVFYMVPLVVLAYVGPSIVNLGANAGRTLTTALVLAYASSLGAASFAYAAGTRLFPHFSAAAPAAGSGSRELIFRLDVPPLLTVMTAITTAFLFGLAILRTGSTTLRTMWEEFGHCVRFLVQSIVVPVLPVFIAATFARLVYEGASIEQAPLFATVVLAALGGQILWIILLYSIGGLVSGKNPWQVVRHYLPAYLTAAGTMSSAATIPVSLACARKSSALSREVVDFMIPLCATIHLCGSVITETLCVLAVSQALYGAFPPFAAMAVFIPLLGIFAVGAPGVPTGTAMGTLGLVTGVLGFDAAGVALLLAAFTLQDSFGTACNVVSDGALALIMEGLRGRWEGKKAAGQGGPPRANPQ